MSSVIEEVPRQLIEGRLLAALDDKECAAVLFNKEDLNIVIDALFGIHATSPTLVTEDQRAIQDRRDNLTEDLIKLRNSAFP